MRTRPARPFILVLRAAEARSRTSGSHVSVAQGLRELGSEVVDVGPRDDLASVLGGLASASCRAVVIDFAERLDVAARRLAEVRSVGSFEDLPSLVVVPEDAVFQWDPAQGFDDFIVEPHRSQELYVRLRRLEWRRSEFATEERVKLGSILIDRAAYEVRVDGRRVELTAKEFSLLLFLAENRGRLFSRAALLDRVWGHDYEGGERTVDIHVRRLRAKLGAALLLETMRGAGYRMQEPSEYEALRPLARTNLRSEEDIGALSNLV